jgi:uracil-DNA glycosylase family 4
MRHALIAITSELKRLKATGVKAVNVSEESLVALRQVVAARKTPRVQPAAEIAVETAPMDLVAEPSSPVVSARPTLPIFKEPEAKATVDASIPPPPIVQLPGGDKASRWAALRHLVLNDPICRGHVRPGKQVVFGVGKLDAQIMFVGEAPGADEEVQGEPFVGRAGELLTKMINGMGLPRGEVYIGNIMNWRPQLPTPEGGVQYGNRPPTPQEMGYCLPYLKAQIEIVNPALVVALGKTAAEGLLGSGSFHTLGEIRGRWHEFADKPLMVTYHPSYILHNSTNRLKRMIWEDLLKVMERAGLPISEKQRSYYLEK